MSERVETLQEVHKEIRAGMDEYLAAEEQPPVGKANNIQIGRAFTDFYIRRIATVIDGITDSDAIDDGLKCDGGGDLGIDFIYPKPDGASFWVYQAKYKGKNSSLSRDEIAGFFNIHKRLMSPDGRAGANNAVKELLIDFSPKKSLASLVLLTNGKASDENKKDFERFRKEAQEEQADNERFDWQLVDLSGIKSNLKHALSVDEKPPKVTIPLSSFGIKSQKAGIIDLSKGIETFDKKYQTVVTVIRGTTLFELCLQHKNSLFNYNIRGFLGASSKNKKMLETLQNEPEFFYLFNNGMSAICSHLDEVHLGGGKTELKCADFQIINGAQTACSIREFGKTRSAESMEKLKKVWVLLRITQAESIKSEKGLNKKIITANNTQNVIKDADFRSNDPVQLSLQQQIKRSAFQLREGGVNKKLVYMPKRVHRPRNNSEIVFSMDDMAKALFCFYQDEPHKLNSQAKFLFDETSEGSYWTVFGVDGEETQALLPQTVKQFAAVALLSRFLDSKLKLGVKQHDPETIEGMVHRCRRHFLWSYGHIVRDFCPEKERTRFYNGILDGKAFVSGGFAEVWFDKVKGNIEETLERDNDNGKTLNFKLWLRDSRKIRLLKRGIRNLWGYGLFKF